MKQIPFLLDDGTPRALRREFEPSHIKTRAVSDTAPYGGGSGCGNVTGYLDSYGTMNLAGAFEETLDYILKCGFLCDGHGHATNGYTENCDLGLFTSVSEDAEGLQLEWAYHPKQTAQDARTTLTHRLDNGKDSGLSIGFFVGDGRTAPQGWTYDPDEEQPDGIDYICVRAQHFEEVLKVVSKPEYYADNLIRAQNLSQIYLFLRVHVFEVSQTLVPANEVSLIAEVRSTNSKPKPTKNMATTRAKREDDDDTKRDDAVQGLKRAYRSLKSEHLAHHADMKEKLDEMAKHLDKLARRDDDDDDDDARDDDHEEPDGDEPKKKSRARKLFEGAK